MTAVELPDFSKAKHTVVLSDIHLTEAEPPHPGNALWKRYKRPKYFVDHSFELLLGKLQAEIRDGPIELVLNGDIFDFDSVMMIPANPNFAVNWVERRRGLSSEEEKSRFKMRLILNDHAVWVKAVRDWVLAGHRVIFIIGNHDVELNWPSVQGDLMDALDLPANIRDHVRFCEWFYVSNADTLIEHSNQYDDYCVTENPIHPTIQKGSKVIMRVPFGNLAARFIMNGIGLMNPHVDSSYIKESLWEYVIFFVRHVVRVQPFLAWTWFWSSLVTLVYSLDEGFHPPLIDPLTVESRVDSIAAKANTIPRVVRSLRAMHVHPAIFNPFKLLRELWLDRALLFAFGFFMALFAFSVLNLFTHVSFWWWLLIFLGFMPFFVFYARSVSSELEKAVKVALGKVPTLARIANVKRVVHGHFHVEMHQNVSGVEVLNTGTWSPAYKDVECTQPYGKKVFAWIRPSDKDDGRKADLFEWLEDHWTLFVPGNNNAGP